MQTCTRKHIRNGIWAFLVLGFMLPEMSSAQSTFTPSFSHAEVNATVIWGVSWVDYDGDGDLDLFSATITENGGNAILRNNNGTFERVTGQPIADGNGGIGHCWSDYDNDGDLDVVTTGGQRVSTQFVGATGGESYLYRNEGNGSFTRIDDGIIGPPAGRKGWSCAWGDMDNDGFNDLIIVHPRGFIGRPIQDNSLFRNNGDGTFRRDTSQPMTALFAPYTIGSWSDYDLDGDLDLFIGSGPATGPSGPDYYYKNTFKENGTLGFSRISDEGFATENRDGQNVNWNDIDNDGDLDFFVTNYNTAHNNMLYLNNGDGTYQRITNDPLVETTSNFMLANAWGDIDNDADLDVLITAASSGMELYLNNGDGTFVRDTGTALNGLPGNGIAWGDYDADGDLDLAIGGFDGTAVGTSVYDNELANGNAWFKIDLEGVASARDAIGTNVRVTATINGQEITQFREVSSQNTFAGMNALTVHVGLGDASQISKVEVTWLSGQVDTYTNLAVNTHYKAVEGGAVISVGLEDNDQGALPKGYNLEEAYPNPFNPSTMLRYALPEATAIRLAVYDALGREVSVLIDGLVHAGMHQVAFEAHGLPSGTYMARLEHTNGVQTQPLLLIR